MKYLSLFSGIGGFELGIHDAFPEAECVGYSEIDKYAIKVYQSHFPEHKNYGDIKDIDIDSLPDFDLLVGGFPCQDLSIAKKNGLGLDGEKSGLFWAMLNILKRKNPKYFCIENVASMKNKYRNIISKELNVMPIMINASLVSAQSRRRLFWCNWNIDMPIDYQIYLRYVLDYDVPDKYWLSPKERMYMDRETSENRTHWDFGFHSDTYNDKSETISANFHKGVPYNVLIDRLNASCAWEDCDFNGLFHDSVCFNCKDRDSYQNSYQLTPILRKFTPNECERLQCFTDDWTDEVSNTQRYKQLGNAVNVNVAKHIMNELRRNNESRNTICN